MDLLIPHPLPSPLLALENFPILHFIVEENRAWNIAIIHQVIQLVSKLRLEPRFSASQAYVFSVKSIWQAKASY